LYADGTERDWKSDSVLDRWILARLDELILESTKGYDEYKLDAATRPIAGFIDDLSVWYLRRSRERMKGDGTDKKAALATVRYVLHALSKILAPSMPFFAEHLFQAIRESEDEESVHLALWPEPTVRTGLLTRLFGWGNRSEELLGAMRTARAIVTQALEARDKAGIRVRQPLATLTIPLSINVTGEFLSIIAEEINVKKIEKSGDELRLDTDISEELREEGVVRDTIRVIQAYRKEKNLKPGESATYVMNASDERTIVEKHRAEIERETNTKIEF